MTEKRGRGADGQVVFRGSATPGAGIAVSSGNSSQHAGAPARLVDMDRLHDAAVPRDRRNPVEIPHGSDATAGSTAFPSPGA